MMGAAAMFGALSVSLVTGSPVPAVAGLAVWCLAVLFDRLGRRVSQVEARVNQSLKSAMNGVLGGAPEEAQPGLQRTMTASLRRGRPVMVRTRRERTSIRNRKSPLSRVAPRLRGLFDRTPVLVKEAA